jgi:2-keto-4-pentenoate hydratase/2-oxohepta-3-ene-1,7-dioic acid hydratase in catechol pathway
VTPDELGDPQNLKLHAWVNGELRQNSSTAEMITGCYQLVADLSAAFVLNPGDVIMTGTPSGCGILHRPPKWLQAGDTVQVEIDGIGVLENQVIHEPA